jgi:hypothetical protein
MALTITHKENMNMGSVNAKTIEVAFATGYPTGGESLTAADVGLSRIDVLLRAQSLAISLSTTMPMRS